ncbi:cylicin 1 [Rattus norvegicus]|uniref:Cylicin 1 n=1 Tax=Rattus norvegicus TaxID=10116 RepID=A0A8I6G5P6_RAT|nr:cylicin 1 [Rattus norvegicus]|eukprot:XP_006229368.1 PREDICTED: cylicin-1 isoform X1 [Rattus norvegicus]
MSLSKLDGEKLTIEDVETSSSSCRKEINTATHDDYMLIRQTREKWNQEDFALTFPKTPMPDMKKRSGPSELEVAVPRQEKRKIEEGQKPTHVLIDQFLREVFLKSSFSLAFTIQAPFKYLDNPQNHYIMAETRKPKDDKKRKTLKTKFREKISSCVINLESMKTITNGKPEILGNTEKNPSKSSHKSKLPKKSNSTSETNLESSNSKESLEMGLRNDNKKSMNFIRKAINNAATCCKDNPNTDSKNSIDKYSDEISECIHSSNMDLMLHLNEFRAESTDFDEWLTNCSQNNAKKPSKKSGKKEKDSDIDSGDLKDAKKEGKKKSKKKKDSESTDAESVDSKSGKKKAKTNKKRESKKKKDTESTGGESGGSKASKKDKEKKSVGKRDIASSGSGSVDSKGVKKVKRQSKKDGTKTALSTDSESDTASKRGKKDEKKENKGRRKPIKDTVSTDADSESEGDSTGKKSEKKDKKITKKGEKKDAKKNAVSTESDSDFAIKKGKKDKVKDKGSYSDSASDTSSKGGRRKISRLSDTESEDSSEFRVIKSTDDSDVSSTDSKRGMTGTRKGFRTLSKKTTFDDKGKRFASGRIPPSRERLPFPPCEPFKTPPKSRRVCQCKKPPPPPKPKYAPLPGVEWIHKLL